MTNRRSSKKKRSTRSSRPRKATATARVLQTSVEGPISSTLSSPRYSSAILNRAVHSLDPRLPATGTILQKRDRYRTVRCECIIEEHGIRYAGNVYQSLSAAAIAAARDLGLNNKTQNGFLFWGVSKPPKRLNDPIAALDRAWERYFRSVSALMTTGITDENRSKVATTIREHAEAIDGFRKKVA